VTTFPTKATTDNNGLPEGWALPHVRDVFRSFGGGTPDKGTSVYWGGTIPWLSSGDIKAERIQGASEFITKAGLESSSTALCRREAVLVVVRSGILKHTLPVALLGVEAAINQDIKCFDSDNSDLNAWLALALRASAKEILALNREGTTVQSVKYETLKGFDLPVPPLPEQKRIVAKVEALLARVNAARERLAKVPTLLKRFRQSVLAAACSGELAADWREGGTPNGPGSVDRRTETTIADVCDVVVDCPHSTPKWTEGGVICLRTTNFQPGSLDLSEVRYVSEATYRERVRRTEPTAGDVLYSREGGILGVACIMPRRLRACLGQRMMLLRPSSRVLSSYLMYLLNSPATLAEIGELTGGTASPHLNVADVKAFSLRLPPRDEQQEIVRRVEALFAFADKIEVRVQAGTARVEKITQAILAKAFRGELVPTEAELARQEGRDYEPASVLLERIRATRAGEVNNPKQPARRRSQKK
jgi:type I restriction enzyme S subunit